MSEIENDFGSVCSGIEAASAAWEPLGLQASWFAEIEPFPSAVLAHRWPGVPNFGDMTLLPDMIRTRLVSAPSRLIGGTPCQAFSVAGRRGSLTDDRGNLTLVYCDILNAIDEVRANEGKPECITTWENVPGVLSTADNAFGCFLGKLAGDDVAMEPGPRPAAGKSSAFWGWSKTERVHYQKWPKSGAVVGPRRRIAWRVLDAQYFGLAQRRKRVFVVASARNGFDPCAVLSVAIRGRDGRTPVLAFQERGRAGGRELEIGGDVAYALTAPNGGGRAQERNILDGPNLSVRRLTPVECERLQGFPDGHTDVPYRNKPSADGPRYKAIGNSKAVPVVRWLGLRMLRHEAGFL